MWNWNKTFLLFFFFLCFEFHSEAQSKMNLNDSLESGLNDNITVLNLKHDSLSSSFLISIKNKVGLHKHLYHAEHVYVISGEGEMILGDESFFVKEGDYIFIPINTPHAVKVISKVPLKVISIQSPYFDGKDRILLE
jgi:mannose-6-phosphate isomerase-like protein (cupin superfamily)